MVDSNKIMKLKEFYNLVETPSTNNHIPIGFNDYNFLKTTESQILQLEGHQLFMRNLFDPHTPHKRLLLYHSTGTGKTMVILSIAQVYIEYFQKMKQQPTFTIIGFTEGIIVKELMKYVDFGYITQSEQDELNDLKFNTDEKSILRRRGLKSTVKRRITDKTRGGYFKFFGYQKFAYDLFIITAQGINNNITHKHLFENVDNFERIIDEETKNKNVEINRSLIESLKYGFIACDEIHNVYNVRAKNNRGTAIEYALRLIEREEHNASPRVIYASATPLTGSAKEVIDVMNLLIPNEEFKRSEFFDKNDKLKPNSLERIGKLCSGYVSFLKDTDERQYPKRILEGVSIFDIEYLKFTPVIMSKLLENTLKEVRDTENIDSLLSSGNYTLYDIAFPNPHNESVGLYDSSKISSIISNASERWKEKVGINIENTNIVTGDFLKYDNIGKYSTKYKELLDLIFDVLESSEPGKMIIYHYYVGTSGVTLINELLLRNGFLNATSAPLSDTRCSICGITQQRHKEGDHKFKPARILLAHGELGSELDNTLGKFNDNKNLNGHEYRILIGSRVIHEGINFNAIRFMYILSLPRDISTLIQLYGRGIRKGSHKYLPAEYRNVHIYTLVTSFTNPQNISPEILHYKRKVHMYLQIQLVERELRRYAVDNFINYDKMNLPNYPTLDGLPYTPVHKFTPSNHISNYEVTTFSAYGYSIIEEHTIIKLLKQLFAYRAIWTESDLWYNITHPFIEIKTPYDVSTFSKDNFILAMDFLVNGTYIQNMNNLTLNQDVHSPYINLGNENRRIIYQKPYYILCPTDELGMPVVDYDSYMRMDITEVDTSISITQYIESTISEKNFKIILNTYLKDYKKNPLISLVKIHPNFHHTVAKYYIEGERIQDTEELIMLYEELGGLVFYDDFISDQVANSFGIREKKRAIGFRVQNTSFIYINKKWQEIPTTLLQLTNSEEERWVGFTKLCSGIVEFKVRPGLDYLPATTDKRKIDRGRSCITLTSSVINKLSKILDIKTVKARESCELILAKMINLQKKENSKVKPRRYFYFYFDIQPML